MTQEGLPGFLQVHHTSLKSWFYELVAMNKLSTTLGFLTEGERNTLLAEFSKIKVEDQQNFLRQNYPGVF